MTRRNRADPWGDLSAAPGRGLFTGNRGCLVDDAERVVRHHRSALWIACALEFRGWRSPLAAPRRWTPIFFLDDAVALAAGHRPCALCRRDAYRSYRDAVSLASASPTPLRASDLNERLGAERRRRGGGGARRWSDRLLWSAALDDLPVGAVIVDRDHRPRLVLEDRLPAFSFDGWCAPVDRRRDEVVQVLTPPTSVAALANGFRPVLHPSGCSMLP